MTHYCPLFVIGENKFIGAIPAFHAATPEEAMWIGNKAKGGECERFGFRFTGQIITFKDRVKHVKANVRGFPVCVIDGPVYEAAKVNARKFDA